MAKGTHADTAELDVFIVNLEKKEVHHHNCETTQCRLDYIKRKVTASSLAEARKQYNADLCAYCFASKR